MTQHLLKRAGWQLLHRGPSWPSSRALDSHTASLNSLNRQSIVHGSPGTRGPPPHRRSDDALALQVVERLLVVDVALRVLILLVQLHRNGHEHIASVMARRSDHLEHLARRLGQPTTPLPQPAATGPRHSRTPPSPVVTSGTNPPVLRCLSVSHSALASAMLVIS